MKYKHPICRLGVPASLLHDGEPLALNDNPKVQAKIKAAQELCALLTLERNAIPQIASSRDIAKRFARIVSEPIEHVILLAIDSRNRIMAETEIIGGPRSAPVVASTWLRWLLGMGATACVMAHNHPSGDSLPSNEDVALTAQMFKACKLIDVSLIDHVIVSTGGTFSFLDAGLMVPAFVENTP
jgi:DNA repair protein RadC